MSFNETLVRRDERGQFQSQTGSAPEVTLVQTADGNAHELSPGVWDDEAVEIYQSGQCLALAVAIAKRESAKVGYIYREEDDELAHAVAIVSRGGREYAIDSYGEIPLEDFCYERGVKVWDIETCDPEKAEETVDQWELLPPQDFRLAESFAATLDT